MPYSSASVAEAVEKYEGKLKLEKGDRRLRLPPWLKKEKVNLDSYFLVIIPWFSDSSVGKQKCGPPEKAVKAPETIHSL